MTVTALHVVVPYGEFLQRRERLCRVASELGRRDAQATVDAEAVAVAVAKPLAREQKYPCPVKNAEA